MKNPHGIFLPESYFPDIPDCKTQPLSQKHIPLILSRPVIYSSPSILSYFLLAALIISGLSILILNAFFWVQFGSFIALISTESLLVVLFSSILAVWVRASYSNPEPYDDSNPLTTTSSMRRIRVKEQKTTDTAQFRILKQDTQSYLVALRSRRDQAD